MTKKTTKPPMSDNEAKIFIKGVKVLLENLSGEEFDIFLKTIEKGQ
ncbi:hypothetical protein N9K75_02565 [bacterium]|nr:hypothetical protein [bacterium]